MKPLKASSDVLPLDHPYIPYDQGVVSSTKFDGNRGLCLGGQLLTSDMKEVRNEEFHNAMSWACDYCREHQIVLDYEVFSPSQDHHAATSGILNSYAQPLPDDIQVHVFDGAPMDDWLDECHNTPFAQRIPFYTSHVHALRCIMQDASEAYGELLHPVEQRPCPDAETARKLFAQDLEDGFEGSMLRALPIWWKGSHIRGGFYKHGRVSNAMQCMFKAKAYETIDGWIIGVQQRRTLKPDWPRRRDANNRLIRPLEKDAYDLTDMIGAFVVRVPLEDGTFMDTEIGFRKGFDLDWRRMTWSRYQDDQKTLIGRWVEFMHMPHGAKEAGKARAGGLVRFRDDREPISEMKMLS